MQQDRFTIAEATGWPIEELLEATTDINCLDFTPAQAKASAAAWAWLLGLQPGDGPAHRSARDEVLSDGDIFVAVNLPPKEFIGWWRRMEWDDFTRTEEQGDAWCWAVLARARGLADGLGPALACQVSVASLVARGGLEIGR